MKVTRIGSNKNAELNISKYRIDWKKKCRSKFQDNVKAWLKEYWWTHVCMEEVRLPGTRMRFDLINVTKRIVVEINGAQHDKYNKHFHRSSRVNFHDQIVRDQLKREWAEANNFKFVEIYPEDLPLTVEFFKEKFNINLE